MADTILLIGTEVFSRILDYHRPRHVHPVRRRGRRRDRGPPSDAAGLEGSILGADGNAAEILWMPAGGTRTPASPETVAANDHAVRMPNGREVFKRAVTEMASSCRELLDKSGYTVDDVDVLIPHQANARIMGAVVDRLGIDPAKAIVDVGRGRQHERRLDPDRPRPRMARRARSTRATSCCSRRSAPGSRGAPRSLRWTIPSPAKAGA